MSTTINQVGRVGISNPLSNWQDLFLEKYAETMNLKGSADYAGVSKVTVYNYIKKDEKFAQQVKIARQIAIEVLEGAAYDRATNGIERIYPAWYKGERVGERIEREFSDGLAQFFLKYNKPEIYNPDQIINHNVVIQDTETIKQQMTQSVQNCLNLGMDLTEALKYLTVRGVNPEHLRLVSGDDLEFDITVKEQEVIDITTEDSNEQSF